MDSVLSCFPVNSVEELDKATLKGEDISYSIFNPVGQLDDSALKVEKITQGALKSHCFSLSLSSGGHFKSNLNAVSECEVCKERPRGRTEVRVTAQYKKSKWTPCKAILI